jgi:DNA-directed RNA polymerase specialized sigma subunit
MLRNNRFHSFAECLDGSPTSALNDAERKGLLQLLAERIAQLPKAPKKVLAMYYYEGLHLADIAACFNLSKTQICQIHTEAVNELHKYMCSVCVERDRNEACRSRLQTNGLRTSKSSWTP